MPSAKPEVKAGPVLKSFEPLCSGTACVLILGSMPGGASLAAGRYYAHPSNRFWPLLAELFPAHRNGFLSADFDERYRAAQAAGLALWDTIGVCEREGSLDSAIRSVRANDIAGLLAREPGIRLVILNGRKSGEVWKKHAEAAALAARPGLRTAFLPSTSPANARFRLADLVREWGIALKENGIA
ncbi:MAG: DNA-deoxyinosine glycosylase [Sutterella sp.]|nr:DNA-deoxyinosine glycosylase [Sutterella sp.]